MAKQPVKKPELAKDEPAKAPEPKKAPKHPKIIEATEDEIADATLSRSVRGY